MSSMARQPSDVTDKQDDQRVRRLDVPVYLDAGIALSLSASLGRGVVTESTVEKASSDEGSGVGRGKLGVAHLLTIEGERGKSQSVAVTESEVRRHTQESIFNSVRVALESGGLLRSASAWAEFRCISAPFLCRRSAQYAVLTMSSRSFSPYA
jgi:hypothetical protein